MGLRKRQDLPNVLRIQSSVSSERGQAGQNSLGSIKSHFRITFTRWLTTRRWPSSEDARANSFLDGWPHGCRSPPRRRICRSPHGFAALGERHLHHDRDRVCGCHRWSGRVPRAVTVCLVGFRHLWVGLSLGDVLALARAQRRYRPTVLDQSIAGLLPAFLEYCRGDVDRYRPTGRDEHRAPADGYDQSPRHREPCHDDSIRRASGQSASLSADRPHARGDFLWPSGGLGRGHTPWAERFCDSWAAPIAPDRNEPQNAAD
jgi:hypothetical protein